MAETGNPALPIIQVRGGTLGIAETILAAIIDASCPLPGQAGQVLTSGGPGGGIYWSLGTGVLLPAFLSFGITGQTTPLEVGATIAAGATVFTWTTSNPTAILANSISIVDTTASTTLASGLANDGTETITISAITNNAPTSQVWTITGMNTTSGSFSDTYTVNWLWRVYAGSSVNVTLTANQIKALADSSALQAAFAGDYSTTTASVFYRYFCYPDSLGSVANFVDGNTGFPISMATSADNAAYSNTANGWSYAIVSVTNAQAVATNYRVYRTQFPFSGTLLMRVS